MLSRTELAIIEKYVQKSCYFCIHPFGFDKKTGELIITKSRVKWWLGILHIIIRLIYVAFIYARLVPGWGYSPNILRKLSAAGLFHFIYIILYTYNSGLQIASYACPHDTIRYYNQMVAFNGAAGRLYYKMGFLPPGSKREKALKLFDRWGDAIALTLVVAFPAMSNNPHYVYSIIPTEWRTWGVYIPLLVVEGFFGYAVMVIYNYATVMSFLYVVSTTFWLRKICIEWLENPADIKDCLTPINLETHVVSMYRCLTLLNNLWTTSFGSVVILFFKTACEFTMIFSFYGAIRMYGKMNWEVYAFLPLAGLILVFEHTILTGLMATIHELTTGLVDRCKKFHVDQSMYTSVSEKNRALMLIQRKAVVSCRPLRCKFGVLYFIEKSTKIDLAKMLVDSLLFLLLSTKAT